MAGHGNANPKRSNSALISENDVLRAELAQKTELMDDLAKAVSMMHGVQQMGVVQPAEVRELYAEIDNAITAFLEPMDRAISEDSQHKDRIMAAVNQPTAFARFRQFLRADSEARAAALSPYTPIKEIWTAHIWRDLYELVFKEGAAQSFYIGRGQNPSEYIRYIDQIVDLMKQADPPVFGEYTRRLWRRQALAAIFRTAAFDWVAQSRENRIRQVCVYILNAFTEFSSPIPAPQRARLVRNIVTAAVQLNENIMIEAEDAWDMQMQGPAGDFYANAREYDLRPMGTNWAMLANTPLATIAERFSAEVLRDRMMPLCIIAPALRCRHMDRETGEYQGSVNLVKPRMLALLRHTAPAYVPAPAPPSELIFFALARSMGYSISG